MTRQDYLYIILAAAGLVFSLPPFPTGLLSFIALIPVFLFVRGKTVRTAFAGGIITGILVACGTVYWLSWATIPGFLGSIIVVAPFHGAFYALMAAVHRRWGDRGLAAAPVFWTGLEILSSWGELAFPWNLLGYSLGSFPELIQPAAIVGVWGISFWIALVNVLFFFLFTGDGLLRKSVWTGLILLSFSSVYLYGKRVIPEKRPPEKPVRISIVQGNIDPYQRWTRAFIDSNFAVYRQLTAGTASFGPDIVVWPETAAPCYLRYRRDYARPIRTLLDSMGSVLITGSADYDYRSRDQYNCSFFIDPAKQTMDVYYKRHLVPFSERVPFSSLFPGAYKFTRTIFITVGNYTAGDSAVVFTSWAPSIGDSVRTAPVICYDSVFPFLVRDAVNAGSDVLIIQTNDGWFGRTSGPYQHAQMAVFRAVENRIWVARSANTGISSCVDPWGRVISRSRLYETAVLNCEVATRSRTTRFGRSGNTVPAVIYAGSIAILAICLIPRRKSQRSGSAA
ncbi:apolipoprotein N-acyltransferase [bacterium]|nr:apolipoprotein N-acyltransferase [bacterium]